MKALTYLILVQMKNRLLMLKKKPAFLILYGFIAIMIVSSVLIMLVAGKGMPQNHFADERIIFLILAGIGLLFLYLFAMSGLSTGSSLFTMPDVGLLFVSPISSKKILLYGLISTMGKSLLGSIFIFYQIGNLKANFGYGFTEIFALFIIFAILILFCQLLSIAIYIFSNGKQMRKTIVKVIIYAMVVLFFLAALYIQKQEQVGIMEAVLRMITAKWFGYVPVAGWATMFFIGVVQHSTISIVVALALFFVLSIIILSLLTAGKADYYEDVLLSTEFTFQTRLAAKEGRRMPRQKSKKIKVKEDDNGIGYGSGAMTLMYKNILEMRRGSRFIFIDGLSMFLIVAVGIIGYNFKLKHIPVEASYAVLGIAIYIQYIMTMIGRIKGELLKPYIYMIPEKSFKKVWAASITSIIKPCVDGFCMFAVFAIFGGADVLTCIFLALSYAVSGAVFVGMTLFYQRVLGGQPNKFAQMFLGIGILFAVMAPAIGASVIAAFLLPEALDFLCMLPYIGFCLLITVILFAVTGNLIDKVEYTGKV